MPVVVVGQRVFSSFDQGDFRHPLDVAVNRVDVQLAEAAGEVSLRRRFKGLVFEKQHVALGHGFAQALHGALRQRSRQVDSRYEAADGRGQGSDDEIRGSRHVSAFPDVRWRAEARFRMIIGKKSDKVYRLA
jgi:hypothetical protein